MAVCALDFTVNSINQRQIIDWAGRLNNRHEDTGADLIQIEDGMGASLCSSEVMPKYSSDACRVGLHWGILRMFLQPGPNGLCIWCPCTVQSSHWLEDLAPVQHWVNETYDFQVESDYNDTVWTASKLLTTHESWVLGRLKQSNHKQIQARYRSNSIIPLSCVQAVYWLLGQ